MVDIVVSWTTELSKTYWSFQWDKNFPTYFSILAHCIGYRTHSILSHTTSRARSQSCELIVVQTVQVATGTIITARSQNHSTQWPRDVVGSKPLLETYGLFRGAVYVDVFVTPSRI